MVVHLRDRFDASCSDAEWLIALGQEGDWSVITADKNILKRPHEVQALRESKVRLFLLHPKWLSMSFWDQASLMVRWFPTLQDASASHPEGTVFEIPARPKPTILAPKDMAAKRRG